MRRFFNMPFFYALLLFPLVSAPSMAQAKDGIVVLELFTSQLCGNTPVANNAIAPFASTAPENLIILSCHVTLMDDEAQKDPYSQSFCDDRMDEYQEHYELGLSIPLMIINGIHENAAGSEQILQSSINFGKSISKIVPIQLKISDLSLDITLPKLRLDKRADIWVFAYKDTDKVSFTDGENANLDVTYSNMVLSAKKIKNWKGDYMNMSFALADMPEAATGYAVFAQYRDFTDIVAAAKIDKKSN